MALGDLDDFLQQLGMQMPQGEAEGWSGLEPQAMGQMIAQMRDRQARAMRAEANAFRRCFVESPDGRRVLQQFLQQTLYARQSEFLFAVENPEALRTAIIFNWAQQEFVRAMLEAIAAAKDDPDDDDNEEQMK